MLLTGAVLIGVGMFIGTFPWLAGFGIGLVAGVSLVEITNARRVIRNWPTIAEVVDWQRVDAMLNEDGRSPPLA